jgi:hypothetical protein
MILWHYSPNTAPASPHFFLHSSLFLAAVFQFRIPKRRSTRTATSHRPLGFPTVLLAQNCACIVFLIRFSSIGMTWPTHCMRLNLITSELSSCLYRCFNSSFLLILHKPCSFTGPNIHHRIFLSKELITLAAVCERVQVSLPYSSVGRIIVLYIQILVLGWT